MHPAPSPAVLIESLRFSWRGSDDFCLAIDRLAVGAGQRLFIEGASGSGKSTLLNLMAGVLQPTAGRVSVLGQNLSDLSGAAMDAFRVDHIGFIFQQFNLIPYLSVMKNVLLPCQFSTRRRTRAGDVLSEAKRLLCALDIDESLHRQSAARLSVGQQQRVAAARALIGRPEILIADEPTSALDARRQKLFLDLLLEEARIAGSTVLFVSHDPAPAEHFDHRFRLDA